MNTVLQKNKNRILWLDALKGIAIISVVFGHALLGYKQMNLYPNAQDYITLLKNWIYTWHMPLFFVLSGIAFNASCIKNNKIKLDKVKRQTINIVIIYLIFVIGLCILKMLFSTFVHDKIYASELICNILLPDTLMWYLWVLAIYYLFFSMVYGKLKGNWYIIAILVFLSLFGNYIDATFTLILCMRNLMICAVFFYIGMHFQMVKEVMLNRICVILSTIFSAGFIMFMIFHIKNWDSINLWLKIILTKMNAFAMIIVLVFIFSKVKAIGESKVLVNLGKSSLIIYLLHTYLVTAFKQLFARIEVKSAVIAIIVTTTVTLLVTYFISIVVAKIPIIKYVFRPIELIDNIKNKQIAK